jgi:hypothetical protein
MKFIFKAIFFSKKRVPKFKIRGKNGNWGRRGEESL